VTINLLAGTGVGGEAQGDKLLGIEGVVGSQFDDTLTGDAAANTLSGHSGNDTLNGGDGNDVLYDYTTYGYGQDNDKLNGGAGNDAIYSYGGKDVVDGGGGNDFLYMTRGDATADLRFTLNGAAGSDGSQTINIESMKFYAGVGDDVITGGAGTDGIFGSDGNDILIGAAGQDGLDGGAGDDILSGGDGVDELYGDSGDDTLDGGTGDDELGGAAGADILRGGAGADSLYGGDGIDTATYSGDTVGISITLINNVSLLSLAAAGSGGNAEGDVLFEIENAEGGNGSDLIIGSEVGNTLHGNAGSDRLDGADGNDLLVGGTGADQLIGGAGADAAIYSEGSVGVRVDLTTGKGLGGNAEGDTLSGIENIRGSNGADTLIGNAGANTLNGWTGNDQLVGGAGADWLEGGAGIDAAIYSDRSVGVQVSLATGKGTGGNAQGDTLVGIENIRGSNGADTLTGNSGANVLNGWAGKDVLTGGAGGDIFSFAAIGHSAVGANADRITDFSRAQGDHIDLSDIDANTRVAGDQGFAFIGTGLFTGVAGQLRYATSGGVTTIAGDINGDKVSDFHIQLTGTIAPVSGDFML